MNEQGNYTFSHPKIQFTVPVDVLIPSRTQSIIQCEWILLLSILVVDENDVELPSNGTVIHVDSSTLVHIHVYLKDEHGYNVHFSASCHL